MLKHNKMLCESYSWIMNKYYGIALMDAALVPMCVLTFDDYVPTEYNVSESHLNNHFQHDLKPEQ